MQNNRLYDITKSIVIHYCYGSDFSLMNTIPVITDTDILHFMSSINTPTYLTSQQKLLLTELLQNMESWWGTSFTAMQSIQEESMQIMGFKAVPISPSPLPLQIQNRLKIMVITIKPTN